MILANELDRKVEFGLANRVWNRLAASVVDNQHLEARSIRLLQQTRQTGFERLPIVVDAENDTEKRPAARLPMTLQSHIRMAVVSI